MIDWAVYKHNCSLDLHTKNSFLKKNIYKKINITEQQGVCSPHIEQQGFSGVEQHWHKIKPTKSRFFIIKMNK